jgi:hypothetical protein
MGVQPVFRQIVDRAGLKPRSASCRPRLHDLRHGFAVNTILDGYRDGKEPGNRIALLSTYLGHVDPVSTYWYLSAAPELLTLGVVYELDARFAGGAYSPFLKKVERFGDKPLATSLRDRDAWAARLLDIVHDHSFDPLFSRGGLDEIVAHLHGRYLWNVLVLCVDEDLLLGQLRKPDAVFDGQHGRPLSYAYAMSMQGDRISEGSVLI